MLAHCAPKGEGAGALLRLALRQKEGQHWLLSCQFVFDVARSKPSALEQYVYPQVGLYQCWLPRARALRVVDEFMTNSAPTVPGIGPVQSPLLSQPQFWKHWSHQDSGYRAFGWPVGLLECSGGLPQDDQELLRSSQRLVGSSLPLYPSVTSAILSFVHGFHGSHDTARVLPVFRAYAVDRRARIAGLNLKGNTMTVQVERRRGVVSDLAIFPSTPVGTSPHRVGVSRGQAVVTLGTSAIRYLLLGLMTAGAELLDEREINFDWGAIPKDMAVVPETRELLVRQWIEGGESARIEFKQELNHRSDGSKDNFLESVVAFANSDGGTIILGVGDHGEMVGFKRPDFEDTLHGLLRDKCDPVPSVDVEQVALNGKPLTLVHVASLPAGACALDRTKHYIRAGATDRLARTEEMASLLNRQSALVPGIWSGTGA